MMVVVVVVIVSDSQNPLGYSGARALWRLVNTTYYFDFPLREELLLLLLSHFSHVQLCATP